MAKSFVISESIMIESLQKLELFYTHIGLMDIIGVFIQVEIILFSNPLKSFWE